MKRKFRITVNNEVYEVDVEEITEGQPLTIQPAAPAKAAAPSIPQKKPSAETPESKEKEITIPSEGHNIVAPLPGSVLNILVQTGQKVESGQTLLILEAMKMENEISSPVSGIVSAILVGAGQNVNTNDILIVIE